ncbi:MAG: outer membrane beta-barrel protein [Alphaproteobacteria bacterium]|nr:outer membrane beta-barrel protein [Alphaproteobacteria bacterium]
MKASVSRGILLCSALTLAAVSARADDGWYSAIGGSVSLRQDADGAIVNAPAPGMTVRTKNFFEPGLGGQVALGRRFGSFRLEGEVGYTRDTQRSYEAVVPATGRIFADVTESTLRLMANAYWDFSMKGVQPYLGAGLGYASTHLDFVAPRAPFPTEQPRQLIDDRAGSFGYQVMAGIAVPVSDRVSLTAQYRWFNAGKFKGQDLRAEGATYDHAGSNVDVGLRFSF